MSNGVYEEAAAARRTPRGPLALLLWQLLRRLECGSLSVTLPNGERLAVKGAIDGPAGQVHLHRWRALRRLVLGGDIGFAESYADGDWSTSDLTSLIEVAARNQHLVNGSWSGAWPVRFANRLYHLASANTLAGSRRNIMSHYDLGNDFYSRWLDPGMSYSSGIFRKASDSLDAAQKAKQVRIQEMLALEPGQSVLEIGIGWGGLAEHLLRAGARLTGVTLSPSQLAYAADRLDKAGLESDLRLQDYREIEGRFDRIVSIEMLEAVGEKWWPVYFEKMKQRLAAGGVAVVQTITIADERFEAYRRGADFIQRHIFPGGMLPAPSILKGKIEEAGLAVDSVEMFGDSYGLTLKLWRERFEAAWPEIAALGFNDLFKRMWEYYLAYCEAGFRAGAINVGLWRLRHK